MILSIINRGGSVNGITREGVSLIKLLGDRIVRGKKLVDVKYFDFKMKSLYER